MSLSPKTNSTTGRWRTSCAAARAIILVHLLTHTKIDNTMQWNIFLVGRQRCGHRCRWTVSNSSKSHSIEWSPKHSTKNNRTVFRISTFFEYYKTPLSRNQTDSLPVVADDRINDKRDFGTQQSHFNLHGRCTRNRNPSSPEMCGYWVGRAISRGFFLFVFVFLQYLITCFSKLVISPALTLIHSNTHGSGVFYMRYFLSRLLCFFSIP